MFFILSKVTLGNVQEWDEELLKETGFQLKAMKPIIASRFQIICCHSRMKANEKIKEVFKVFDRNADG